MFSMAAALGSMEGCTLQSKPSSNGGLFLIFINNGGLGLTDDALDLGSQIGFLSIRCNYLSESPPGCKLCAS
jgi:hypothetical protein